MSDHVVVAIDGPAGAGKSTVTRRVAEELGFVLLDTGALYRSVALAAKRRGVDWGDEAGVGALTRQLARDGALSFSGPPAAQRVAISGEDVSEAIRAQEMGQGASRVSALPQVRAALLDLQRGFAGRGSLVAEGRDIGTVVFPDATAKFFLTASSEERARRRHCELLEKGSDVAYETVLAEVIDRDERDSRRAIAPLVQAPDAIVVDSTRRTIEEVVAEIVRVVRDKSARP